MSNSSRLAYLLGEMRREKNGAVADFMRFYGAKYGLNYGVSLATIRAKAQAESSDDKHEDHRFAHLLYKQEVRELQLAAFWFADAEFITSDEELDFWAKGIINSEVAEEAAFALLYSCQGVERWLEQDGELLHYAAVMAIAKSGVVELSKYSDRLIQLIETEQNLLPKAIVVLLSASLKFGATTEEVNNFLNKLPAENSGANYIREEISWRLEF